MTSTAQWRAERIAVNGCRRCHRASHPKYRGYCAIHVLEMRNHMRRLNDFQPYVDGNRGRPPRVSDEELLIEIANGST